MSETTIIMILIGLVGLVALGLGFVVLVQRGGSFRLRLRSGGVEFESNVDTCDEEPIEPDRK